MGLQDHTSAACRSRFAGLAYPDAEEWQPEHLAVSGSGASDVSGGAGYGDGGVRMVEDDSGVSAKSALLRLPEGPWARRATPPVGLSGMSGSLASRGEPWDPPAACGRPTSNDALPYGAAIGKAWAR